jgi:hypothetical protein
LGPYSLAPRFAVIDPWPARGATAGWMQQR